MSLITDGLPPLSTEQIEVLRRFLNLEVERETMLTAMSDVFSIEFDSNPRVSKGRFRIPEPGICVKKHHIENALREKRLGHISENDLVCWATVILMNDAFEIDSLHEDLIADWLNDTSYNLGAGV